MILTGTDHLQYVTRKPLLLDSGEKIVEVSRKTISVNVRVPLGMCYKNWMTKP